MMIKKKKRKLTAAEREKQKQRRKEYMSVFINGKQKRVKRTQEIDRLSVDEKFLRNADPIWLHQNELWEYLQEKDNLMLDDARNPRM